MGSSPVAFEYLFFFRFVLRFANFFVFILDFVHNLIHVFEFIMHLYNKYSTEHNLDKLIYDKLFAR